MLWNLEKRGMSLHVIEMNQDVFVRTMNLKAKDSKTAVTYAGVKMTSFLGKKLNDLRVLCLVLAI